MFIPAKVTILSQFMTEWLDFVVKLTFDATMSTTNKHEINTAIRRSTSIIITPP
ncbi:MAG TPA: hypothetical protein VKX33_09900 [Cyclobacteriaceae bacterium]|nr:hypothetical protein [Cyclobacteriaceae bacterium]